MDKKETKGIRLPLWMWDWLDRQDDARGVIVEDAIKKVHVILLVSCWPHGLPPPQP